MSLYRENGDGSLWLEPGAGDGAIVCAVQSWQAMQAARGFRTVRWVVTDIREECRVSLSELPGLAAPPVIADFLSDDGTRRIFDVAIGNPPYRLAMEFIQVALRRARYVAFLLRLGFLESKSRHDFMRRCPPDVYVLPDRPSFSGKGTDATAYAWMVWNVDDLERPFGKLRLLNVTSAEERRANP
jgi:hypothetical protein